MPGPDQTGRALRESGFGHASEIVELLVLTTDGAFLDMMRTAAGQMRRVWQVASAAGVGELLSAGAVGILVLDCAMLGAGAAQFIVAIKRQFPDLVILSAGDRNTETALAALIGAGTVYRFIHRPVSPGRAKSFADAAVKRLVEQRAQRGMGREVPAAHAPRDWLIGGSAALAVLILIAAFMTRGSAPAGEYPASLPLAGGVRRADPAMLSQTAAATATAGDSSRRAVRRSR